MYSNFCKNKQYKKLLKLVVIRLGEFAGQERVKEKSSICNVFS